jgi:hypothetical protein
VILLHGGLNDEGVFNQHVMMIFDLVKTLAQREFLHDDTKVITGLKSLSEELRFGIRFGEPEVTQ